MDPHSIKKAKKVGWGMVLHLCTIEGLCDPTLPAPELKSILKIYSNAENPSHNNKAFPFSVRGLKRVFLRRDNALKLLPFWNSVLSFSSALLAHDLSDSEDSGDENLPKTVLKRVSAEAWKQNVKRGGFIKQASLDFGIRDNLRIVGILSYRCWDLGFPDTLTACLDDSHMVQILNDLYGESSDAKLTFRFFSWYGNCSESKNGIRSVCAMIRISVSGNMNHELMRLLGYLVRNRDGGDGWHDMVFNFLGESCTDRSVLETVYSMLVSLYVEENMIDFALKSIYRMKVPNFFPAIQVCHSLIRALLESERLELAWEVFEEMQCQNAATISLFIHKYCAEGSLSCACKLLVEMKNYGCEADIVAYTIVIDALSKRGLLKEATSLLCKIIQMGLSLDSVSVASVVNGYHKAGGMVEAMDVLKVSSSTPDIFMYTSFISEFCSKGNVVNAIALFDEISELVMFPDCFSYTTIIEGCCKVGDKDQALKYFGKMLKKGLNRSIVTYTVLINGFCKIGDLEAAEHLFDVMTREGLKPDVVCYNVLIDGHSKKGYMHNACEWLGMMRIADVSPDIATYNILIHGLIKRGFVKQSREILNELIMRGVSPDKLTFTNIIHRFVKEGSFQEVYLLLRQMSEKGLKPDVVTCSAFLNGYCKAHRMQEADALFHKMLDASLDPDMTLYNTLVQGYCRDGNIQDACRVVTMMVKHGLIPNDATYWGLVFGFDKYGVENAAVNAFIKLHQILLDNGIDIGKSHYAAMLGLTNGSS